MEPNDKRLNNLKKFTKENAAEYGRKGGTKSGQSKRNKKTLAESLRMIMESPVTNDSHLDIIRNSGLPLGDEPTYKDFVVASITSNILRKGNIDDLTKLMGLIGESPLVSQDEDDEE